VRGSFANVRSLAEAANDQGAITELQSRVEIEKAVGTGGGSGTWGYINRRSGWADAEAGMRWLYSKVVATNRVNFITGEAVSLLQSTSSFRSKTKISGVQLKSGQRIEADLVILATGAWTGKLINLSGRAQATGQVLCYLSLTEEEQERLGKMPVLLNMSTGLFIIPPQGRVLKVARHGYGYTNPTTVSSEQKGVSVPMTIYDNPSLQAPLEGQLACRGALEEMIPELKDRPFTHSKICWYNDTPKGDFLITYHPDYEGLFLATGGSGHGYKFLPVIGERIVDVMEGKGDWVQKWAWPKDGVKEVVTEDGSRGGEMGMVLQIELQKGREMSKL
jgi:sarcosine oxidase/L-pipecolate oxidase